MPYPSPVPIIFKGDYGNNRNEAKYPTKVGKVLMTNSQKTLELLSPVVQQLGLEVTYVHQDLVLVSDNPFVLKLTDRARCIELYFNEEMAEEKAETMMAIIEAIGETAELKIEYKGAFSFQILKDDSIEIELFDLSGNAVSSAAGESST